MTAPITSGPVALALSVSPQPVAPDGGVSIEEPSTSHIPTMMKSRLAIGRTGYPWSADRAVSGMSGHSVERAARDRCAPLPQSRSSAEESVGSYGTSGSGWSWRNRVAASPSMSELSTSQSTARRWARVSRKACHAGRQMRMFLVQHVFETTKGALALNGSRQPASGFIIAGPLGEVGHVLVSDVGRQGIDADQVQVIEVDGCLAVDTGVRRLEHDLSGLRIDQPAMLVVGLVAKSGSDLLQVQAAQVKHRITISRHMWPAAATA
ncbi:MAG: hypothetical protein ACRDR6_23395 [Pseudonocardiaceae bacterium]